MYKPHAIAMCLIFLVITNLPATTIWQCNFESPTYDSSIPWAEHGTYNTQSNWFALNIYKGDWNIVTSGGPSVLSGTNMGKKTATSPATYLSHEFTAQTDGFTARFAVAAGSDAGSGACNTIWIGDYSVNKWGGAGIRFTHDSSGLIINYWENEEWYPLDMDPNTTGFQYASADTWYKFKLHIWPVEERLDIYVYDSNDTLITTVLHLETRASVIGANYDSISLQYDGTDTSATFYYDDILIDDSAPAIPTEACDASDMYWDSDDATKALQYAINSKQPKVIVPNMGTPWKISKTIQLTDNQELELANGAILEAKEGSFLGHDPLLQAIDRSNVTIDGYGATLRMQKDDYMNDPTYTSLGHCETRHGISILGCDGVNIEGLTIKDTGGDGIYVDSAYLNYSSNVVIRNVTCDNNYRQGISVLSARNMLIEDCSLINTCGTAPASGIDLEPSSSLQELSNFVMRNCYIEDNYGPGILVYLRHLAGSENDVSVLFENCTIINSSTNSSSGTYGIAVGALMDDGPDGLIEFKSCTIDGSNLPGIYVYDKSSSGTALRFTNCTIKNTAKGFTGTVDYATTPISVVLTRPDLDNNLSELGNVEFLSCTIEDYKKRPYLLISSTDTSYDVRNIQGDFTVYNPYGIWAEYDIGNVYNVNLETRGLSDSYAGFEETRYSAGNLLGQQKWYGYGSSSCSREVVASGTDNMIAPQGKQMVKFSSSAVDRSIYKYFARKNHPLKAPFTISYCIAWDGSLSGTDGRLWATWTTNRDLYWWAGSEIFLKRESDVVYFSYLDGETEIKLDLDSATGGILGISPREWYRVVYSIRPAANSWDIYVYDDDGTLLASQANIGTRMGSSINNSYNCWETWSTSTESGSIYLDDICLQSDQTYRNHVERPAYQIGNLFDDDNKNWLGWKYYGIYNMSSQIVDCSSEPVGSYQGENCIKLSNVTGESSIYQYFATDDKPVITPFANSYCFAWNGSQSGSDGKLWATWTTNRDLCWWAGSEIFLKRENNVVYLSYLDGETEIKLDLDSATGGIQGISPCEWYRVVYSIRPAANSWDIYVYDDDETLLASQTNIGIRMGSSINNSYNCWETWGYNNAAGTLYLDYYDSLYDCIYYTGFNIPYFEEGNINNQNGWTVSSSSEFKTAEIAGQTAQMFIEPDNGTELLMYKTFTDSLITTPFTVKAKLAFDSNNCSRSRVYVTRSTNIWGGVVFGFYDFDGNGNTYGLMYRNGSTCVQLDAAPGTTGTQNASANTWYSFVANIDPANAKYDIYVYDAEGGLLDSATNIDITSGFDSFDYLNINTYRNSTGAGYHNFYIDDISILDNVR